MIQRTSVEVHTPLDQKLMVISKLSGIPSNAKEISIGQANNIMSIIPNLLASTTLANSYKVILPPGSAGDLMKYKDGLLGTPIVDPTTGKIIGHAGLQSLQPQAIALGVFTVVSFVTGQYFMAEINQKLTSMKDAIHKLQATLMNLEKAEVFSSMYFLDYADQNINEILENREHQVATLTNVQSHTIKLLQATLFYEMQIKTYINNLKNAKTDSDFNDNYSGIIEMISLWRLSTYGFYYGKILEIRLSGNRNQMYLNKTKTEMDKRSDFFKNQLGELYKLTVNALEDTSFTNRNIFENIWGWFNENYTTNKEKEVVKRKEQISNNSDLIEKEYYELQRVAQSIDDINDFNKGVSIYFKNGKTYIEKDV